MKKYLPFVIALTISNPVHAAENSFLQQMWNDAKNLSTTVMETVETAAKDITKSQESKQSSNNGDDNQVFQDVWDDFSEVANEAIDLATKSDKNSRTAIEFLTAQEPKYIRLLKKAQDILSNSEANGQFEKIYELQNENKKLKEESIELKTKRVSAPTESMNPLVKTKKRIDERLAEIPEIIYVNENHILALQQGGTAKVVKRL